MTKERLIESVWPGIPTTDDSLVQCIARIRRTLGHEVVETFPKRGYRLRLGSGPAPPRRLPTRRSLPVALAICVALALTAATNLAFQRKPIDVSDPIIPPAIESDRTLAVLPFVNLSGDPDLRYFSDGLSEDLTTDLSKVQDLTVISQASSFDFRDAELGFQRIAEDLCGTSYEGPFATTPIASGSTWP